MATVAQWVEGARPRTLPAAFAPVIAGTGVAAADDAVDWLRAGLCLVVAVALQVAVNYANDYSDGVRGTDAVRVGPLRLVGSGAASPAAVKRAAFAAFGVAAVAGLALAAMTTWWLVAVGALAILAAWGYTGGPRPYGYAGLGELFVFVFFGLVAVGGTAYVQIGSLTWLALTVAVPVGLLACAILVANNLRDLPRDAEAGKHTLAVKLGDAPDADALRGSDADAVRRPARPRPHRLAVDVARSRGAAVVAASDAAGHQRALPVPALIPVLKATGLTELLYAILIAAGLALGA